MIAAAAPETLGIPVVGPFIAAGTVLASLLGSGLFGPKHQDDRHNLEMSELSNIAKSLGQFHSADAGGGDLLSTFQSLENLRKANTQQFSSWGAANHIGEQVDSHINLAEQQILPGEWGKQGITLSDVFGLPKGQMPGMNSPWGGLSIPGVSGKPTDWMGILKNLIATGGKMGLSSLFGGSGSQPAAPAPDAQAPAPAAPAAPTQPLGPTAAENIAAEQKRRQQAALQARRNLPDLQSQTGDSLSPDYLNAIASQLAGVYGDNPGTINPGGFSWMDTAMKGVGA